MTRFEDAESALRNAWRVNIADLNFRTVTVVTVAVMLAICLFVVAVLPAKNRQTPQTDAIEFALVTLLTVVFSPLSFNYAYVWLMYPDHAGHVPRGGRTIVRAVARLKVAWIVSVVLIPALAIPMPLSARPRDLIAPALLLVFGLGAMLFVANHPGRGVGSRFFFVQTQPSLSGEVALSQARLPLSSIRERPSHRFSATSGIPKTETWRSVSPACPRNQFH